MRDTIAGVPGALIIAATPIGNPGDASDRLRQALSSAPLIAAEDTRRLRRLADALGIRIRASIVSLFEGNEARRTAELVARLLEGDDVLLVSDAGMPTISDPGQRLVAECAAKGIPVTAIPGPSAVAAAVAVSGLATGAFCFEGFLPRKPGERHRRLARLAKDDRATVFFESPRRIGRTLTDLAGVWGGDRPAVVCRELTKTHEQIRRGTLEDLAQWASEGLLGEITIVVAGAQADDSVVDPEAWRARVAELTALGLSRRDAIAEVAESSGAARRDVYAAVHDGA